MHRNAVVVSNGKGQLWAQVAAGGEYVAWMITDQDAERFRLREYDEIVIEGSPKDQFCRVVKLVEE